MHFIFVIALVFAMSSSAMNRDERPVFNIQRDGFEYSAGDHVQDIPDAPDAGNGACSYADVDEEEEQMPNHQDDDELIGGLFGL